MQRLPRPAHRRARREALARLETLRGELVRDPPAAADVVTAETDVGPLLLHAADEVMTPIIVSSHAWEPGEAAWLRGVLRGGQTVLDVGANVGYFTLLAAQTIGAAGTVVAVEPDAANLRLLRANVWRGGCDNVRIVAAAASDERGLLALRRNAWSRT